MLSWREFVEYQYAYVEDAVILMSQEKNEMAFHPPSGKTNQDLLRQVIVLAQKQNASFGFIKKQEKDVIASQFPGLQIVENRDFFDYVYRASDLAELSGTKYAKIRNRLNKFKKSVEYSVEDIKENNIEEVLEFLKRWCLWKDCASDELLENERKAIVFSMAYFFDLGLSGLALRIKDEIEAIAVYEKMNTDTVVVHFEKGSPDYDGIYKAINMETAQRIRHQVPFIDREEDLGISGLRRAKMSYHPDHFVEIFKITEESLRTGIL